MAEYSLKNLFRYRKRYVMFGVILLSLTMVLSGSAAVYDSVDVSRKTTEFALRLAVVSGILLVIMADASARLMIAVRQNDLSVGYMLGVGKGRCLASLGLELLIFYGVIWLTGAAVKSLILGYADWRYAMSGLAAAGLITVIRLAETYLRIRRKTALEFMKEGKK